MLPIENVLSPSIRNLFSAFLKMDLAMWVLQTAVLSLLLVKNERFPFIYKKTIRKYIITKGW